jgi:hypothetical protein
MFIQKVGTRHYSSAFFNLDFANLPPALEERSTAVDDHFNGNGGLFPEFQEK